MATKARKEINKEAMYQKIIPSSLRAPANTEDESVATPVAPVPAAAAAPREPVSPDAVATVSAAAATSVAEPVAETPTVINMMERLVEEKIDRAIEKFRCCNCTKCKSDITAIALNKLAPKYVLPESQALETALLDQQANAQAATAIVQAILVVKSNPRHDA